MTAREPTVFWCSSCKDRHAGDCPPVKSDAACIATFYDHAGPACPHGATWRCHHVPVERKTPGGPTMPKERP